LSYPLLSVCRFHLYQFAPVDQGGQDQALQNADAGQQHPEKVASQIDGFHHCEGEGNEIHGKQQHHTWRFSESVVGRASQ